MDRRKTCSNFGHSRLSQLLVERTGLGGGDPIAAIEHHVERLRQLVGTDGAVRDFGPFLKLRKVRLLPSVDLDCDGYIRPQGGSYTEGFTMLFNKKQSFSRSRFTIAHEICHTFFYELVPELKFVSHQTDPVEERLCDIGAAALLMPEDDVVRYSREVTPSMALLEQLADHYGVSVEAMFLRLQHLAGWTCQLMIWRHRNNGHFVLDRAYQRFKKNWYWVDSSIPRAAWQGKDSVNGWTFVFFQDSKKCRYVRRIYFQVKRRATSLIALWSKQPLDDATKISLDKPEHFQCHLAKI